MPFDRFYIDQELHEGARVSLAEQELHHAHVLRIQPEDAVDIVNGKGILANAIVVSVTKKEAALQITSIKSEPIPLPKVTLAIPFMRMAKLEWVIEKCTELDAFAFWLYKADHSEQETLNVKQLERLKGIAISAMKQCGRLYLPEMLVREKLGQLFGQKYPYIFGDPQGPPTKQSITEDCVFITGPEKGFSPKERQLLSQNASGIKLSRNVLRAETAPIAALCLMQYS